MLKIANSFRNGAFDDVIPQNDADPAAFGEVFCESQGFSNTTLTFLIGVVNVLQAELFTVRQKPQKIAGIATACHDQKIANACFHKRLDRVVDHGLVIDGKQMFIGDFGQGKQTAACSAR